MYNAVITVLPYSDGLWLLAIPFDPYTHSAWLGVAKESCSRVYIVGSEVCVI